MTHRWITAAAVYRDPRMVLILVLGFSSGLPLALTGATLTAWLTKEEIDLTTIGLFALMGLPYTLKFLWSPLVDGLPIPILSKWLGQRRGWMVASQLALACVIAVLGLRDPKAALLQTAIRS